MRTMLPEYATLYNRFLEQVVTPLGHHDGRLVAFWPMCGELFDHGLMVVGRSPNGWRSDFDPDEARTAEGRKAIVQRARMASERPDRCPMLWMTDLEGNSGRTYTYHPDVPPEYATYNTRKSAFLRVLKTVALGLSPETDRWPSRLCWTNLCKVAPQARGNPSTHSYDLQARYAPALLDREVRELKPRSILVMTGRTWFEPFAREIGLSVQWRNPQIAGSAVEGTAVQGSRCWVITPHPQGKDGDAISCGAIAAFHRLAGGD